MVKQPVEVQIKFLKIGLETELVSHSSRCFVLFCIKQNKTTISTIVGNLMPNTV